jgi:hypothetical protein
MSFDEFWAEYPLKKGKGYARKCYDKARKNGMPSDEVLIQSVHEQEKEKRLLREQNKFCPEWKNPSTWINQECWSDICLQPYQKPAVQKTYTINTLHSAFTILSNLGQEKFKSYCLQVGLTRDDQIAVWNKWKGAFNTDKLPKMKSVPKDDGRETRIAMLREQAGAI